MASVVLAGNRKDPGSRTAKSLGLGGLLPRFPNQPGPALSRPYTYAVESMGTVPRTLRTTPEKKSLAFRPRVEGALSRENDLMRWQKTVDLRMRSGPMVDAGKDLIHDLLRGLFYVISLMSLRLRRHAEP